MVPLSVKRNLKDSAVSILTFLSPLLLAQTVTIHHLRLMEDAKRSFPPVLSSELTELPGAAGSPVTRAAMTAHAKAVFPRLCSVWTMLLSKRSV